jgi:phenylalanyl-tRNA synthetase beta chain
MKISEAWLREWANPSLGTQELVEQLSVSGLEVDEAVAVAEPLEGVVIGEVLEAVQHPNADRLRLCTVTLGGDEPLEIVCGAPNARAGVKFPVAPIGTKLPGGMKIRKSKIRGVVSNGMLCSASELGLGDEHDGILELPADAPLGESFSEYFSLDDHVIDIDLTPNRGDCLGLAGIAREVGVLNRVPVNAPVIEPVLATIDETFPVHLDAPQACPRYIGRIIRNIDPLAKSPLWMTEKLRRCGLRPLSPLVDVTNYVMLELGQPMHAFDREELSGSIRVRYAAPGESLKLLDGRVVDLTADVLVIADEARVLALAGVMGGEGSGISDSTQHLFLECAFFAPLAIIGKARRFGLHTDASHRYERGVDPQLQRRAVERATALLLDIVGGEAGPIHEVVNEEHVPVLKPVNLRASRIIRLLGRSIDDATVVDVLTRLGMDVEVMDGGWTVTPPSYRFDIAIEEDLIEELARVVGFDAMPTRSVQATSDVHQRPEATVLMEYLQQVLIERGYQEAITFSFVDSTLQSQMLPDVESLPLSNPISSDMAHMRTSLWPGLLGAVLYNLNRQADRVRLFETGLRFQVIDGELAQTPMMAGAIIGPAAPEQWGAPARDADFFDLKGDIEALVARCGDASEFTFEAGAHSALHPGQTASIVADGAIVGHLGALHPAIAVAQKIRGTLLFFEVELDALTRRSVPAFKHLSRYPAVRRDLSIIVDEGVSMNAVEKCVGQCAPDMLKNLGLFDVYRGEGIDSGRKSLSLQLTFQADSRTLNDEEIDMAENDIVHGLQAQLGAVLRG